MYGTKRGVSRRNGSRWIGNGAPLDVNMDHYTVLCITDLLIPVWIQVATVCFSNQCFNEMKHMGREGVTSLLIWIDYLKAPQCWVYNHGPRYCGDQNRSGSVLVDSIDYFFITGSIERKFKKPKSSDKFLSRTFKFIEIQWVVLSVERFAEITIWWTRNFQNILKSAPKSSKFDHFCQNFNQTYLA